MENSRARLADAALYRRGESITAWARVLSVGFALVAKHTVFSVGVPC